jgi:RNA polymerase sigma-70 factor (ECF subfamily)
MRQHSAAFSSLPPVAPLPPFDLAAAIPRMRRYARVLTRDSTRADDLVQDALARAWEKRHLWRPGTDLRAWLFTIMHNVHVNQRALARYEAGNVSYDSGDIFLPDGHGAVDGHQIERVELREVAIAIDRLPLDQREVLLLAAVEELRYDEIAAVLAIPIGTVMSRLSRARGKLRRVFSEEPEMRCVNGRGMSPRGR